MVSSGPGRLASNTLKASLKREEKGVAGDQQS